MSHLITGISRPRSRAPVAELARRRRFGSSTSNKNTAPFPAERATPCAKLANGGAHQGRIQMPEYGAQESIDVMGDPGDSNDQEGIKKTSKYVCDHKGQNNKSNSFERTMMPACAAIRDALAGRLVPSQSSRSLRLSGEFHSSGVHESGPQTSACHIDHCTNEDPAKLADFEAKYGARRAHRGDDCMPPAYREGMSRWRSITPIPRSSARCPKANGSTRAPSLSP